MTGKENSAVFRKRANPEKSSEPERIWMSVKEMGDLLGIRKTDRYWLVHKNVFETSTIRGKMWVNIESFEKWYQGQKHYRTAEDREKDQALEDASLTFPQAAAILGLPRKQLYLILKDKRYSYFFEFVEVAGRRRVTKASFGRFLNGQDRYHVAEKKDPERTEKTAVLPESTAAEEDEFKTKEDWLSAKDTPMTFMTIEEAALQSGISPQAISRYAMRGHFGECRKIGGKIRIPGKHFQEWMKKRQEGEMAHGFD